jgi:hypothetical protein
MRLSSVAGGCTDRSLILEHDSYVGAQASQWQAEPDVLCVVVIQVELRWSRSESALRPGFTHGQETAGAPVSPKTRPALVQEQVCGLAAEVGSWELVQAVGGGPGRVVGPGQHLVPAVAAQVVGELAGLAAGLVGGGPL